VKSRIRGISWIAARIACCETTIKGEMVGSGMILVMVCFRVIFAMI
jgi:hypothetical protein